MRSRSSWITGRKSWAEHGRPAVIVKVNPKTFRVKFDMEWMNALNITKVPYDALSQKCKEAAQVKLQRAEKQSYGAEIAPDTYFQVPLALISQY